MKGIRMSQVRKRPPAQVGPALKAFELTHEPSPDSALNHRQAGEGMGILQPNYPSGITGRSDRILRRPEVESWTGLSRSTIYEMMTIGTFPRPVRLGKRAVGWTSDSIAEWLTSRQTALPE